MLPDFGPRILCKSAGAVRVFEESKSEPSARAASGTASANALKNSSIEKRDWEIILIKKSGGRYSDCGPSQMEFPSKGDSTRRSFSENSRPPLFWQQASSRPHRHRTGVTPVFRPRLRCDEASRKIIVPM